jgi:hypothetical protein
MCGGEVGKLQETCTTHCRIIIQLGSELENLTIKKSKFYRIMRADRQSAVDFILSKIESSKKLFLLSE